MCTLRAVTYHYLRTKGSFLARVKNEKTDFGCTCGTYDFGCTERVHGENRKACPLSALFRRQRKNPRSGSPSASALTYRKMIFFSGSQMTPTPSARICPDFAARDTLYGASGTIPLSSAKPRTDSTGECVITQITAKARAVST